jgi:hypothetical protein
LVLGLACCYPHLVLLRRRALLLKADSCATTFLLLLLLLLLQMAVDLARYSARSHQVASLATAGNDRMHQIMAQVRAAYMLCVTLIHAMNDTWPIP